MANLVILECAFCGKAFQVEYARRWQQYCSVACGRRAQKAKEKAKEKAKLKATFFKEIIPHVNMGDDFSKQFIGRVVRI